VAAVPVPDLPGARLRRALLALLAALAVPPLGPGTAHATGTGLQIHHLLPENGAVLAAAPDQVEIMFDADPMPSGVDVAVAPDDTGRLVALPGRPVVDGPVVVQPLPALRPGRYTVGVQVVDRTGHLARGTFGFTLDPAATPRGAAGSTDLTWLIPAVATALLLPVALLATRRGDRRRVVRRRLRAPAGSRRAGPGRAGGRTPTSASSPAAPRGR
jgi:methionine-rich copper-binding protein CopC